MRTKRYALLRLSGQYGKRLLADGEACVWYYELVGVSICNTVGRFACLPGTKVYCRSIAYEDCSLEERHRVARGLGTEDVRWPRKAAVTFGKGGNSGVHKATFVRAVA